MLTSYGASSTIVKVNPPKKKDVWTIRFLIGCAFVCMVIFILWFIKPEHMGYGPIYWVLVFALFFKLAKMVHEWYHYWSPSVPAVPIWKTKYTVDILTTACPGEPHEMIIRTLKAMVGIKYPHSNYLCDEGNDPILKKVCDELGVNHVIRSEKTDAKAGNINNALKQATGDICVILDPDHQPIPEFLDRVLPYFEDPELAYAQCVQSYHNQSESFIAKAAAEQSYHFYGPMMMCMNTYGTVQAIGANCTFRRKALDSIGGHAAGLAEDMHTAMQLQAKGWKSVYVPEILTKGLVPATLSAYYKQQLKWSRGCFELLFRTYPILFKNFTWRQKFHHLTMPLYFLFGLITFIDIIVPLLSLGFARVAWEVNLAHFALFFLPLCGLSMLIRLFAQRWLLEKHERGFHLAAGILRTATWWILLTGFIYSIFKIKVPYIPTPKEKEYQNYWRLSIPNILIALITVFTIIYGLSIDWTPYSLALACYGSLNIVLLGIIIVVSQQKFLLIIKKRIASLPALNYFITSLRMMAIRTQEAVYGIFRNGPIALTIGVALVFLSYNNINDGTNDSGISKQKESDGFYLGVSLSEKTNDLQPLNVLESSINKTFDIISFKQNMLIQEECLPKKLMNDIHQHGAIPMIVLDFPLRNNSNKDTTYMSISNGNYNDYFSRFAAQLRNYAEPVFLNFAPGFDEAEQSNASSEVNGPAEFIKAWQYVYTFFNNLGISNVTWVWSPKYSSALNYYPGEKFVDWIGISCLNYAPNDNDKDQYSFSDLYSPFRNSLGDLQKPVMITEFGTLTGSDQSVWMNNALKDVKEKYHEIKSVIIYNSQKGILVHDKQTPTASVYLADFTFKQQPEIIKTLTSNFKQVPFRNNPFIKNDLTYLDAKHHTYKSKFVNGKPGKFTLMIKNKPYYIRGVAYNTAHDWRDGNMPLTRRQVEKDFKSIKAMGANTIRRYDDGIYDQNVLNIAAEYDLQVLYGFWFDPKVDYYKDTLKVKEYIRNVEEKVLKFKNDSSVLGWSLGNETWGLLKHNFSKPYLTIVRRQYVKLVELLAQRIHELDPTRPVFSCMEHEIVQLPGELAVFHDGAPSLDVIGINSYYKEQISQLNHVTYQFDSLRPYLVSEFGPKGYWDPHFNRISNGLLVEDSETEKAEWYKEQWKNYVEVYKGSNIGGFAYCWHDRMEGSYTWFGLTDYKGRPKPTYYALKELWTKQKTELMPNFSIQEPPLILPGKEYKFTAQSLAIQNKELTYEWYLHKDDYLERVDNIEYFDEGKSVKVKIPKEISNYRLYLYVSDQQGNVTTASIPIRVK